MVLLLPEWRLGLQVVHDELAGGEGIAAMAARHRHQHDLVVGLQVAVAVDHGVIHDLPLRARLLDDLLDRVLGHAGVMLQRHRHFAHLADEARHRADAVVLLDVEHLEPEIKILLLDRDLHPPVTGGKKAISSPGLSGAFAAAMSWLTATRTTFMSASTCCQAPPRCIRWSRRPATVLADMGMSTTSASMPRRSRRLAKNKTFTFTGKAPSKVKSAPDRLCGWPAWPGCPPAHRPTPLKSAPRS